MKWLLGICALLCWPVLAKDAQRVDGLPLFTRCAADDGGRAHCALDTTHDVQMVRQLSESNCIRGTQWDVEPGAVWVAYGCRAEFRSLLPLGEGLVRRVVRCDSDGRKVSCPVILKGAPVRLLRQLSAWPCRQDRSWGVRRNEIWVSRGCRGEFEIGAEDGSGFIAAPRRVTCESKSRARRSCGITVERGVRLLRQISSTPCKHGSNWGWSADGIWVNDGCRAEFLVD